ncbi:hypothetical protein BJ912DRAFT_972485 [Pholiota molesta]|nr:hypothetical protein BJ912DRAFT_972485 [Pholiota molesta]
MHTNRTAYIYHQFGSSMNESSDEVVLLPQSPIEDLRRLSPLSLSSHNFFFESTCASPMPYEEKEFPNSRYVPPDVDFFSTQEMQSKFRSSFDTLQTDDCHRDWQLTDALDRYNDLENSSNSEDSEFEMDEDIRSASPSICATARIVKITPLRVVRRSVRRSSLPETKSHGTHPSSAEGAFNTHAIPLRSLSQKLSVDNLKRLILPWRTSDLIGPIDAQATSSSRSSSDMGHTGGAAVGDITIIELHDVTQEAVRLAEMMSYKWKFEPAVIHGFVQPSD